MSWDGKLLLLQPAGIACCLKDRRPAGASQDQTPFPLLHRPTSHLPTLAPFRSAAGPAVALPCAASSELRGRSSIRSAWPSWTGPLALPFSNKATADLYPHGFGVIAITPFLNLLL